MLGTIQPDSATLIFGWWRICHGQCIVMSAGLKLIRFCLNYFRGYLEVVSIIFYPDPWISDSNLLRKLRTVRTLSSCLPHWDLSKHWTLYARDELIEFDDKRRRNVKILHYIVNAPFLKHFVRSDKIKARVQTALWWWLLPPRMVIVTHGTMIYSSLWHMSTVQSDHGGVGISFPLSYLCSIAKTCYVTRNFAKWGEHWGAQQHKQTNFAQDNTASFCSRQLQPKYIWTETTLPFQRTFSYIWPWYYKCKCKHRDKLN